VKIEGTPENGRVVPAAMKKILMISGFDNIFAIKVSIEAALRRDL
jgi:hypothetical protein